MKYLRSLFLLFSLISFTACSSDDNDEGGANSGNDITLTCTPDHIEAQPNGGKFKLDVTCSRSEWTAFPDKNSLSWMTVEVSGSTNTKGTVTLTVAANTDTEARSGAVIVKSGNKTISIPVTQNIPFMVSDTKLYSASTGETLRTQVTCSGEWTVKSNDSWITAKKTGSDVEITTLANKAQTPRTGSVDIIYGEEKITITIIQNSAEDTNIVTPEGYRLVWNDEFNNGKTLGNDWTHEVWRAGQVNNEEQEYVNGSVNGKRVTELVDGRLHINCFKDTNGKIYSGRVYAKVKEGWLYGYMEAKIKLPSGKGTWPAFWMMPVNFKNWPEDGEIDIMEEVGVDANWVSSTIHCNKYNNSGTSIEHGQKYIETAESDFHVYACEWTASYLRFFVDGEAILTYKNDGTGYNAWPFDQPYYIILNLAWGGAWGGYKGTDESALPVTMEVDYVRVFQKK